MNNPADLARLVPGFDFLQGLLKGAGNAALPGLPGVPGMGQWIAPTLDPKEIEKRIGELKTVQFWLEQNARLLGATIQALEVQRMTLSTLQTMNLPLADIGQALKAAAPVPAPPLAAEPAEAADPEPSPPPAPARRRAGSRASAPAAGPARGRDSGTGSAKAAVDPMQWWGALTTQFTELASQALQERGAQPPAAAKPARRAPGRRKG